MKAIDLPDIMGRALNTKARYVILFGGRCSGKSHSVARIMAIRCYAERSDILCGREYQNSIDDSVHKIIKNVINDHEMPGFTISDKKIDFAKGGGFRFKGFARNPQNVKSAEDFKYCWIEEAQSISQGSLDDLLPTIRSAGSQLWFTMNPQSSEDPIAQRFLVPFWEDIQRDGYYEDDLHCIIRVNWRDNKFFSADMERNRQYDLEHMPRAKYEWVWEGQFNDSIDDPLIKSEWFDACVDAHKQLGFEPLGIRVASHDPSDMGPDAKGYVFRHGSVIKDVRERHKGDVNEGCDWALGLAIQHDVDRFIWDSIGMGASLKGQITRALDGHHTQITMFNGAEKVDRPNSIYEPIAEDVIMSNQRTIKEVVKNKRAQYYAELRRRVYNTYEAVVKGVYHKEEDMISFSSDIDCLAKLKSELCRIPIKPNANGMFELYTKYEMKNKFKLPSPNLADAVMMSLRVTRVNNTFGQNYSYRPKPMGVMGITH